MEAQRSARLAAWRAGGAGAVGRAADALVRWRLGLIRYHQHVTPTEAEEAAEFWRRSRVGQPAALAAEPVPPGRVRRLPALDLRGPSSGPGDHPGARELRARAHLRPGAPPGTPLVLLLHGYAAAVPTYEEHHARLLLRRGLHAARLDLPYHLRRKPPGSGTGAGFFSSDPRRTAAMLRQATEDAAAVVAWARAELGGPVGVLGFSLGGLVACLLAAEVPLDSVVAVTPPVDLADVVLRRSPARTRRRLGLVGGGGGPWGADLEAAHALLAEAMAPVTPHLLDPLTPGGRITLVAADNDGIVGAAAVHALAATWGTALLSYPHGHVTVMTARGITARLHDRLAADLLSSR